MSMQMLSANRKYSCMSHTNLNTTKRLITAYNRFNFSLFLHFHSLVSLGRIAGKTHFRIIRNRKSPKHRMWPLPFSLRSMKITFNLFVSLLFFVLFAFAHIAKDLQAVIEKVKCEGNVRDIFWLYECCNRPCLSMQFS